MKKYVYLFSEGNKDMRNLLGGKGANLAEMTNIGLPVPQGFTVTTEKPFPSGENGTAGANRGSLGRPAAPYIPKNTSTLFAEKCRPFPFSFSLFPLPLLHPLFNA